MFTKNYFDIIKYYHEHNSVTLKNTTGANYSMPFTQSSAINNYILNGPCFFKTTLVSGTVFEGITVGSGNTPATFNDYKLESPITTGIMGVITCYNGSVESGTDGTFECIIQNSNTEPITIREVGYIMKTSSSGTVTQLLIERTVLDAPITIPADAEGKIVYTFHSSFNTQNKRTYAADCFMSDSLAKSVLPYNIKDVNGNTRTNLSWDVSWVSNVVHPNINTTYSFNTVGFQVGNGTTPAAKTDYRLENVFNSNTVQILSTEMPKKSIYIVINISNSPITISEYGHVNRGTNNNFYFLLDRQTPETPITLQPNEMCKIEYNFVFNYPED